MTRTPLCERRLPNYSRKEEIANMTTHIIGGAFGLAILVWAVLIAAVHQNVAGIVGGSIYGFTMITLYTVSSVYHGLKPGYGKKVMQVIDHCTIYFLIAGTYTPILLAGIRPLHPVLAWVTFGVQWGLVAFGVVFTAIDHNRFAKLSMICYIGMGWCIVLLLRATVEAMGIAGFAWLIGGGILYTVGAGLYGIGKRKPFVHTVFHVFVNLGSLLQAICILFYVL